MLDKRKGLHPNNKKSFCPLLYFELLKPSPTLGLNLTFKKKVTNVGHCCGA
jgi:hypothetical protein